MVRIFFFVKISSIALFLSITIAYDLEIEKMYVKMSFLCGDLEEEICMTQPKHFIMKGK